MRQHHAKTLRALLTSVLCAWVMLPLSHHTLAVENVGDASDEILDLSLEDLLDIQVTSVSKKAQSLSSAPAAIYVITERDIQQSGAITIPDALRMVPGLYVARIDSSKWAITSRGFNGRFSNKLLVLMDGRSVYSPSFSGVYWEVQDTLLEEQGLERINSQDSSPPTDSEQSVLAAINWPGSQASLKKAIGLYLRDLPNYRETVLSAIANGDPKALYLAAHTLKSSSAYLGFAELSTLCTSLERHGKSASLTLPSGLLTSFEMACEHARKTLSHVNRPV